MASMTQIPLSGNAGLVGLAHEIRNTSTDELVEQYDLIGDIHPVLWHAAKPRFTLVVAELQRRGWRRPIRLLTSAELMEEYGA